MSSTLPRVEGPADAELISAVRGGDVSAYGDLFERHVGAARRLARQLVSPSDADDLVSAAFAKVLAVLQRGGGPDVAFRAYLLTSVRRLHVDQIRAGKRVQTTDDITAFDPGEPFRDTAVEGFESGAAARAFASLPERWQLVLWHTEVEGHKPADIAPMLGMSANSVAALAYRAREGLRQAFLTMHAGDLDEDGCRFTHQNLGPYVRGGTSRRDSNAVREHLGECRKCMAIYLELTEVNSNLAGILGPIVLGGAAAAYVAAGDVAVKAGGLVFGLGRLRDFVTSQASGAAIAGVAATAVLGGSAAFLLFRPDTTALMTADPDRPGIVAPSEAGIAAVPSGDAGDSGGSGGSGTDGGGDGVPGDPGTDATDPGDPGAVPPTDSPTDSPTSDPTTDPTGSPTSDPTGRPTGDPTDDPTDDPTGDPTGDPTSGPTTDPTTDPTVGPTELTPVPTDPTTDPTVGPTELTAVPTDPTTGPTDPTTGPTDPTTGPTDPTTGPTDPTTGPTDPTTGPTDPTTGPTDPTTGPTDPTTGPTDPPTDPPGGRDASVDAQPSGSGDSYTVSVSLRQLLPGQTSHLLIDADDLDLLATSDERCEVGPGGGLCTFSRGAAENLFFTASPDDGEVGSLTFTIVPTWIDPNLTNNVDRVLIGTGASDDVPAAQSMAVGLLAANLTLLAARATRSRLRSSRPERHKRRSS